MQNKMNALVSALNRGLIVLLLTGFLSACEEPAVEQMPPPVEVGTVEVQPRELTLALEYAAQLRGVREVEVRARVSGILLERLYQEGSSVDAGDLLFRIDPDPFRAESARARAELGVQQAGLQQARRERDRILPLYEQQLASLRERDAAVAAYESAEAAVAAAEAQLRSTELNLSYTEVRAPIGGLTSREVRSEGSLVTATDESSLLTYIVQADRLYVHLAVSESDAGLIHQAQRAMNGNAVGVRILDARGNPVGAEAKIEFIAPRVDEETGTVAVRALLDNRDGALLPGRIVRARIEGVTIPESLVIPKRAVMRGAQGAFVWLVGDGEQVTIQPVQLGATSGNDVAVVSGLSGSERVVVDGILKVQPGALVNATPIAPDDGMSQIRSSADAAP